ncbi:hypothetical protein [Alicyclobacillus acidiphilus]|uniref:hypothetical protein n=1 Tax=Alicyclobacillus acidiphilus TaxID=182455 RepID=UPI000835579E|nr:hypothetical protein [Alicyclobacillus acidiphilus]
MRRLERFRWVPMLLRAYYDAQRQMESTDGSSQTAERSPKDTPHVVNATTYKGKSGGNNSRSKKSVEQIEETNARIRQHPSAAGRQRQTAAARSLQRRRIQTNQTTQQLYRELREANRRLEELASMQKQLESINEAMNDVHRQIESLRSKTESKPHAGQDENPPFTMPPLPPGTL